MAHTQFRRFLLLGLVVWAGLGCGSKASPAADNGAQTAAVEDGGAFCNALTALKDNCTQCHNPAHVAGAPMSLLSYQDLMAPSFSDPAKPVYQLVSARIHDTVRPMPQPPLTLSAEAMAAIDTWVAGGAGPGLNSTCAPAGTAGTGAGMSGNTAGTGAAGTSVSTAGASAVGDTAGTPSAAGMGAAGEGTAGTGEAGTGVVDDTWPADCEAMYTITAYGGADTGSKYTVAAGAEVHPQFTWTAPWGAGEVQAVKFRPILDNMSVLHHWILYGPPSGGGLGDKFISGWAPGSEGDDLPPNVGMYLPSGQLRLDVHYYNKAGSTAQEDKSGVEICVIKTKANFREFTAGVIGLTGSATANAATTTATPVTCTAQVTGGGSVTLLGVSPHMHKLGVHAYLALTPAGIGSTPVVLHNESFTFDDQRIWPLDNVQVNSGDKLTTTCTYNNTTDKTVRFGQNTDDEMCFNFTTYYPYPSLACGMSL